MNSDELVASLHRHMEQRRQRREKRRTAVIGSACGELTLFLAVIIFGGRAHICNTAETYSGATLLFENAGPYVLTALVAFMLGVVITVLLRQHREKENSRPDQKEPPIERLSDSALAVAAGGKSEEKETEERKNRVNGEHILKSEEENL